MFTPFDELTEKQLAQVAYLFADECFGTNPRAYLYELDRDGDVTTRAPLELPQPERAQYKPTVTLHAQESAYISQEAIDRAQAALDSLAAALAEQIYQHQMENIIHVSN